LFSWDTNGTVTGQSMKKFKNKPMKIVTSHFIKPSTLLLAATIAALLLGGCASSGGSKGWNAAQGPSRSEVLKSPKNANLEGIQIVDVNSDIAKKLFDMQKQALFSEVFGQSNKTASTIIRAGDVVEVSVWEAPPATLFGGGAVDPSLAPSTTRVTTFPNQMVDDNGAINIPFAGRVPAAGRSANQVEKEILKRLAGKANQPQILVRMIQNNSANVTIVGEVAKSTRMPLTPGKERLLDALAAAGGSRQPIDKVTLQLTRGNKVQALPLDTIIRDPKQNIVLQPGDVLTTLFQPLSFTALGATGKNEEINFEAKGISLAQALGRMGGLQDSRSDARGVFIFRLEEPSAVNVNPDKPLMTTPDGKVPVVYRVDLKDPATFFAAQSFPIKNGDVIYVSNSPSAEFGKFLNTILSTVFPITSLINSSK
jgi:polysaccharide biosynthesis/export protein